MIVIAIQVIADGHEFRCLRCMSPAVVGNLWHCLEPLPPLGPLRRRPFRRPWLGSKAVRCRLPPKLSGLTWAWAPCVVRRTWVGRRHSTSWRHRRMKDKWFSIKAGVNAKRDAKGGRSRRHAISNATVLSTVFLRNGVNCGRRNWISWTPSGTRRFLETLISIACCRLWVPKVVASWWPRRSFWWHRWIRWWKSAMSGRWRGAIAPHNTPWASWALSITWKQGWTVFRTSWNQFCLPVEPSPVSHHDP